MPAYVCGRLRQFPAQTGQPLCCAPVRVSTRALQTCPCGHCHHTYRLLPAMIISGLSSPLSVGCHSAATSGATAPSCLFARCAERDAHGKRVALIAAPPCHRGASGGNVVRRFAAVFLRVPLPQQLIPPVFRTELPQTLSHASTSVADGIHIPSAVGPQCVKKKRTLSQA